MSPNTPRFLKELVWCVLFVLCTSGFSFSQVQSPNKKFEILKNLEIFSEVYKNLELEYVDEIDPEELIQKALDAMLGSLDPYTVYIPVSEIEDFKIMTLGQYGGIGSTIQYRDGGVYIAEPYENFPADKAGLQPGDRILEVDGVSTAGKSTSEVSNVLKGQAGTTLRLTIGREGESKPFQVELQRAEIKIDNVTYFELLPGNIGYIRLDGFTKGASEEVRNAFLKLKNQGMKSLIIDLRYNGGGLLTEAVEIVNLFYPKNSLVVKTSGKQKKQNKDFHTQNEPLDLEIPLIFLSSRGTASSSEIVCGSLQDYDRALVVGMRSFGKGLVQNILPLSYDSQMKLTVSKYYIPSGRCIQAIDYFHKDQTGHASKIPDSLRREFKTKNGRPVYDGDGIEPDVEVIPATVSDISIHLYQKFMFFDFANQFRKNHKSIGPIKDFHITDAIYQDFIRFTQDRHFEYQISSETLLNELKKQAETDSCWNNIATAYAEMEKGIQKSKTEDFQTHAREIKSILREEIVGRYYYQKGRAEAELVDDETLEKAVSILKDLSTYRKLLRPESK